MTASCTGRNELMSNKAPMTLTTRKVTERNEAKALGPIGIAEC